MIQKVSYVLLAFGALMIAISLATSFAVRSTSQYAPTVSKSDVRVHFVLGTIFILSAALGLFFS